MEPLLILIGGLAFLPLILILRGIVFCKLWAWFIAPLFGLAPISIPAAIGIALIVIFFQPVRPGSAKETFSARDNLIVFFMPIFGLVIGFIVHLFL